LDQQQARLVARLREARGAPVSFDELRSIGIENPALLCYELEAVGLPVTRTCSAAEGMPAQSARLEPERAVDPQPADRPGPQPRAVTGMDPLAPVHGAAPASRIPALARELVTARAIGLLDVARRQVERFAPELERPGRDMGRFARRLRPATVAAMLGLALALSLVVAIVVGSEGQAGRARLGAARTNGHPRRAPASPGGSAPAQPPRAPSLTVPSAPPAPAGVVAAGTPTRVSPEAAAALQAGGHQLLAEGSYAGAVADLGAAIRASGQSLPSCLEPASEACLTFAYALYDLGRALRLEGRHAEAVTILSERLRIDNQRPVVQHELELARGARA
jgi:hypothetical protein